MLETARRASFPAAPFLQARQPFFVLEDYAAPRSFLITDPLFKRVLKGLGYLSQDGMDEYVGPPQLENEGWRQNKTTWNWQWVEDPALKLLREHPDQAVEEYPDGAPTLSRLDMKVIPFDPDRPPKTAREARRIRQITTHHGYRRFVDWASTPEDVRRQIVTQSKSSQ